jgi:hypothetical protein
MWRYFRNGTSPNRLVFGRCSVRISLEHRSSWLRFFTLFLSPFGQVSTKATNRFLPNPFQFITHHIRLCSLDLAVSLSEQLKKNIALPVKREVISVWTEMNARWLHQVTASSRSDAVSRTSVTCSLWLLRACWVQGLLRPHPSKSQMEREKLWISRGGGG